MRDKSYLYEGIASVKISNMFNRCYFNISSVAYDILNILFSLISDKDDSFEKIELTFKEVEKIVGKTQTKKYFILALESLRDLQVEYVGSDNRVFCKVLDETEFSINKNSFSVKFHKDMSIFLLKQEKGFTIYYLRSFFQLDTFYSKRLYSLLMQFKSIGFYTINKSLFIKIFAGETKSFQDFSSLRYKKVMPSLKKMSKLKLFVSATLEIRKSKAIHKEDNLYFKFLKQQKGSFRRNTIYDAEEWKELSLNIKERDNFTCRHCFSSYKSKSLNVHHLYYINDGREIWEYEPEALITLCSDCHKKVHRIA